MAVRIWRLDVLDKVSILYIGSTLILMASNMSKWYKLTARLEKAVENYMKALFVTVDNSMKAKMKRG